jgi:hypothetical protein
MSPVAGLPPWGLERSRWHTISCVGIHSGVAVPIPLVPTGPRRGEERKRNNDGQWRKKRDDTGKPRK